MTPVRKFFIAVAVLIAILWVLSLFDESQVDREIAPLPDFEIGELTVPESRPFLMGFAYQPYDWSEEAFTNTFDFVDTHGDIIMHYFDEGAPWEEAFLQKPYPANVEEDFERRLSNRREGQHVALMVNPLGLDRATLGGNWSIDHAMDPAKNQGRPGRWADKKLDDPDVIKAFGNFCENVIERFQPTYFFYAAEVNWSFTAVDDPQFQRFITFARAIYTRLKARYPELPISIELIIANEDFMRARVETMREQLKYSDLFGVSTYPYIVEASKDVVGDARKIPENWFSIVNELFPNKQMAVLETGFNAKGVAYWDRRIPGNETSQDLYTRFLLSEAARLNFAFVSWWVHRDYDLLWEKMSVGRTDDAFSQWNGTGLQDGAGNPRKALVTWDRWHALPLVRR